MKNGSQTYLNFDAILKRMADYCVYRDRSVKETEQKLKQYRLTPEAADRIMAYLIENDFLDDERFARSYVRGKFYQNAWGKRKIVQGLHSHGITDFFIRRALDEIDEEDYRNRIARLIERKMNDYRGTAPYKLCRKVAAYLYGKGYAYDEFKSLLDEKCKTSRR